MYHLDSLYARNRPTAVTEWQVAGNPIIFSFLCVLLNRSAVAVAVPGVPSEMDARVCAI